MKKYKIRETQVVVEEISHRDDLNYTVWKSPTGEQFDSFFCKSVGLHLDPIEYPKPLRLYAWIDIDGSLTFVQFGNIKPHNKVRAPEYDIIYPVVEERK